MAEDLNSIRERLKAGQPLRVLGLGDSLTFGWEVSRGFFDRFVDGLEERYPETPIERLNAGVPGDTAAGGLSRVGRWLDRQPHLAVVQFAINDCFAGVTPEAYAASLTGIGRRLVQAGVATVLATSCSVAHLDEARVIEPFYAAVGSVGRELGLPVAELHLYWEQNAGVEDSLFGWDGIHPTDSGHTLMAEGLLETIKP